MAVYKHISSKSIIRKVMRDLGLSTDNWIEDAIEWMGEALEHIGASPQLEKKVCTLTVNNYTACLPSDLYYINLVATNNLISGDVSAEIKVLSTKIGEIKALLDADPTQNVLVELRELNARYVVLESMYWVNPHELSPLEYATSEFPTSLHCDGCINRSINSKDTYFINGGKVKTSFISGTICLSYMAFPVDEDCYPMLPDDVSFKEAMFWFIYKKLLLRDPNIKNNGITYDIAEQQWKYYCTQARNAAVYPDIAKYESFLNQWVRLIPRISEHDNNFETLNTREQLNRDY